MDRTIGLIISATVVMISAVVVMMLSSGGLGDLQTDTDDLRSQGCEYQIQQAQEDSNYADSLSSECRQSQQEQNFVGNTIQQLQQS